MTLPEKVILGFAIGIIIGVVTVLNFGTKVALIIWFGIVILGVIIMFIAYLTDTDLPGAKPREPKKEKKK